MKNLWLKLEGNKTKIGFVLVGAGELISQSKPEIGFWLLVAGYIFGGVGVTDAVRRAIKPKGV